MSPPDAPKNQLDAANTSDADRFLEQATLANVVIHALAMVVMALLLARMLPGGGEPLVAKRIGMIAEHPWLFRLGWLPWQLCAVVDVWFAIALVRARWIPKVPAIASLLLTALAVLPDQYAQAVWITRGVSLAQAAHASGDLAPYLRLETEIFALTASWGALFYTLGALGWTACFARTSAFSRVLGWLSIPTWGVMLYVTTAFFFPPSIRPSAEVIAAGNAIGFALMEVWLVLLAELVLRRRRPFTEVGRSARWRHPSNNPLARLLDLLANSRFASAFLEPMPDPAMRSDITDVVYINYLVPAEKLLPFVPQGLELQRLGPDGRYGLFTFLTYNHGHFGFRLLGPLRALMPSPLQSNWRIHVKDPRTGHLGIFFLTNAITNTFQAVGARLLAEGMPMHVFQTAELRREEGGTVHLLLEPGPGSAPDARATLSPAKAPELAPPWNECFSSFHDFLAYCVPQDRAMSTQPWTNKVTRHEITLGIPLDVCEPLVGVVESKAASRFAGDAQPVCFRVPSVAFSFEEEARDKLSS